MNNDLRPINTIPNFKRFCMTIGELPTSYLETMTYYEMLVWFTEYMKNTIIPTINNNGLAIQELQDKYNELKNYVDNYFNNLDVQEEINNKLDTMVVDGTLENLIGAYIQPRIDAQNTKINSIESQLNGIASGSPLVATSVAEMSNTSKIYVNTTDGYWYYYNGTTWVQGGVYQSTGIGEKSILPENTTFYDNINLIPKLNWIQGKVIDNTGDITNYPNGCYNEEYVEVTPGDTLYIINNDIVNFNYMKLRKYTSDKSFIGTNDLLNRNSVILEDNVKYIRFTSWNNNFATLPDNCYLIINSNTLSKLNNYNIYNKINNNYKDNELTKNILIENENRFLSLPYTYGLTFDKNNIKFNNIRDAEYNGTINQSVVYTGMYMLLPNLQSGDTVHIDLSGTNNEPYNVELMKSGDSTVAICRKIDNYHYVAEITDDMLMYKNDMYILLQFSLLTSGNTLKVHIKFSINNHSNTLEEYINNETPHKKFILLGDSITHMTGNSNWFLYLQQKLNASLISNVAVDGAHLMDYDDTGAYDGNPVDGSHNNVLGNQVQKIINNQYDTPDFIMIAIGTNYGISATDEQIYNTYYNSNNQLIDVNLVDRKTSAGAFRWCNEKLHETYPNAKIIWCTPIQGTGRNNQNIIDWGNNLKKLCAWSSNYCIDTEKCGISITNASEYLADGLHPNPAGARLMGEYNASEIKKFY